jgi:hypothetical protein
LHTRRVRRNRTGFQRIVTETHTATQETRSCLDASNGITGRLGSRSPRDANLI